jgi:hypothetical protein
MGNLTWSLERNWMIGTSHIHIGSAVEMLSKYWRVCPYAILDGYPLNKNEV